jgi:hypothetical protein
MRVFMAGGGFGLQGRRKTQGKARGLRKKRGVGKKAKNTRHGEPLHAKPRGAAAHPCGARCKVMSSPRTAGFRARRRRAKQALEVCGMRRQSGRISIFQSAPKRLFPVYNGRPQKKILFHVENAASRIIIVRCHDYTKNQRT